MKAREKVTFVCHMKRTALLWDLAKWQAPKKRKMDPPRVMRMESRRNPHPAPWEDRTASRWCLMKWRVYLRWFVLVLEKKNPHSFPKDDLKLWRVGRVWEEIHFYILKY